MIIQKKAIRLLFVVSLLLGGVSSQSWAGLTIKGLIIDYGSDLIEYYLQDFIPSVGKPPRPTSLGRGPGALPIARTVDYGFGISSDGNILLVFNSSKKLVYYKYSTSNIKLNLPKGSYYIAKLYYYTPSGFNCMGTSGYWRPVSGSPYRITI